MRDTMGRSRISNGVTRSKYLKAIPGSDRRLQVTCVKEELVVIGNQNVPMNSITGLGLTAHHALKGWFLQSKFRESSTLVFDQW